MRRVVPEGEPVKIALLGAGTVGGKVWDHLINQRTKLGEASGPLKIIHVVVSDPQKPRNSDIPARLLSTDIGAVLEDPNVDLVVSLLGREQLERQAILMALGQGLPVVTANKFVIARNGPKLFTAARENGVGLFFEAAVGGGIPIIRPLLEELLPNTFTQVDAIINGTTNYMLTQMAEGNISFDQALSKAQSLGLAEPDPRADVEGHDAAYKLAILASLAFRRGWVDPGSIYTQGISALTPKDFADARKLGYVIKLLASAKDTAAGIEAWVAPTLVPLTHPLASVHGHFNAVHLEGQPIGRLTLQGEGAGGLPTSASIWADIQQASRFIRWGVAPKPISLNERVSCVPFGSCRIGSYVRMSVADYPGVLGKIATIFGSNGVSVNQILQFEGDKWKDGDQQYAQIVVDLDPSEEGQISESLEQIAQLPVCQSIDSKLRVMN